MGCAEARPFLLAHWIDVDISKWQFYCFAGVARLVSYIRPYWPLNAHITVCGVHIPRNAIACGTAVKGF